MLESFITALIIYFVVIDPVGNAPIFLAVTVALDRARKLRTAIEGSVIASGIMLFFALSGAYIPAHLNITEATFKIAGGIIQSCETISFVLALGVMIAAYFDEQVASSILFLGSILLMLGSILLFTREIQIASTEFDVHLFDLESHLEWEQYLKLKRRISLLTKKSQRR